MKKIMMILTFNLLAASTALAGFDGIWQGELDYTSTYESDVITDRFICEITMAINPGVSLQIDDPNACTYTPMVSTVLDIQGNQLYLDGNPVGEIHDNYIVMGETYSDGAVWKLELSLTANNELKVTDTYEDKTINYSDITDGILKQ